MPGASGLPGITLPATPRPLPTPSAALPALPTPTPAPPVASPPPNSSALAPSGTATYTDAQGSFSYAYYTPNASAGLPLVLVLHGCQEAPPDFEAGTRWFEDARANNYSVVMPQHLIPQTDINPNGCWQYWNNHYRGRGEPEVLAGLVRQLAAQLQSDPNRIYVAGMSSGGAMSAALAADYPDLFAAVAIGSGTEYQPCVTDDVYQCYLALTNQAADQDPVASGRAAFAQLPSNRRIVPAILFQGDVDTVVAPFNLSQATRSLAVMNDGFASGGVFPGAITDTPQNTASGQVPGGYAYNVYTAAGGNLVWYVIHGMNHAWSGGVRETASNARDGNNYNDPKGPNETQAFRAFLLAHALNGTTPMNRARR